MSGQPKGQPGADAGRHPKRHQECEACGVVLILGVIAGCYVAGFGYSGWLALGVGLHVWLLGALGIRVYGRHAGGQDNRAGSST